MAVINCPECGKNMKAVGTLFVCEDCALKFQVKFTCAECGSVPEEISSCGSTGYFCQTCNALRSRTSMKKEFVRQDS